MDYCFWRSLRCLFPFLALALEDSDHILSSTEAGSHHFLGSGLGRAILSLLTDPGYPSALLYGKMARLVNRRVSRDGYDLIAVHGGAINCRPLQIILIAVPLAIIEVFQAR